MPSKPLPDGWTHQAFMYALEPLKPEVESLVQRSFGARRFAHNWAVARIKSDMEAHRETGEETQYPSAFTLGKLWNVEKHQLAVNEETGEPWWQDLSKHVYEDGIRGAADAYDNWVKSRSGKRAGPSMGFPRFHKKGKKPDSFTINQNMSRGPGSSPGLRIDDNRRLRIPKIGVVRTCESMRKLGRLVEREMATIQAVTVKRRAGRYFAILRVRVLRPQRHHKPTYPESRVGVDIGQRCLAVVATPDGTIVERVENPAPLKAAEAKLRLLQRQMARRKKGSNRWLETKKEVQKLHYRVASIREDSVHKLTTRLAKIHGEIVIEDLNVAGMIRGGGKHLRDANLGQFRQRMEYKPDWYGSNLVLADRFFASSKTCSRCGHKQDIGNRQFWTCEHCQVRHDRDENAAVNLARWQPGSQSETGTIVDEVLCGLVEATRVLALRSEEMRLLIETAQDHTSVAVVPPREAVARASATPQGVVT